MEDPIADAVGELVLQALRGEGRRAEILRWPDREDRRNRGADFVLAVDDSELALEVTTTAVEPDRRLDALADRLANRVRARLEREITGAAIGRVVVYAVPSTENGLPPARRDVDASVGPIVARLRGALPEAVDTRTRLELGEVGAVERLTIHVYPGGSAGLSVIAHSPRAGFVTALAERVVRDTVAAKTPLLAQYEIAHLALVRT